MPKRVRISFETSTVRDFAPGIDNVTLRRDGVDFYAPETFHCSPFFDRVTPVFVFDLLHSADIVDVYGLKGLDVQRREKFVLLKNHPVRRVRIMGRIRDFFTREMRETVMYYLNIDDSSGAMIIAKLPREMLWGARMNDVECEAGALVEIIGSMDYYHNSRGGVQKELMCEHLKMVDNGKNKKSSINTEAAAWREVIKVRHALSTPWYQTPIYSDPNEAVKYRMTPRDLKKKLMQRNMELFSDPDDDVPLVLDSSVLIHQKGLKKSERSTLIEVDEVDSDSDLEEITKDVFERKVPLKNSIHGSPPLRFDDDVWFLLSDKRHPLRVVKKYDDEELTVRVITKMATLKEVKFPLVEIKEAPDIKEFLGKMAEAQGGGDGTTKKQFFEETKRSLKQAGLIRCFQSGNCSVKVLHLFYKDLVEALEDTKMSLNPVTLITSHFVEHFNHHRSTDIEVSTSIVDRLIYIYLKSGKLGDTWRYNKVLDQWTYDRRKPVNEPVDTSTRRLKVRKK